MTAAAVLWAYRQPTAKRGPRFTLVTLAACADTDHRVAITIDHLAALTGYSMRATSEHLRQLHAAGLLLEQARRDTTGRILATRYTLTIVDEQPIPLIDVLERTPA